MSFDALSTNGINGHSANHTNPVQDVLVIGGGPAGLGIATGLARQLYNTVVFDSGVYRNEAAKHMHNVPTWDHQSPAAYRLKARKDLLTRYDTVRFEEARIDEVHKNDQGLFEAKDSKGRTWTSHKLALATGVRDIYPNIKGYGDVWARGVYHCLFCHGYEERGADTAGVLAVGDIGNVNVALHMAYMARRLAKKVTIYTDGVEELGQQITAAIKPAFNLHVDNRPISSLAKGTKTDSDVEINFPGGAQSLEGFIVHKPKSEVNGPFAQQLKLELTDAGDIKTNGPFHETSVSGVFAAGDCGTFMKAVTQATAMGALAAGGLAGQLQQMTPMEKL